MMPRVGDRVRVVGLSVSSRGVWLILADGMMMPKPAAITGRDLGAIFGAVGLWLRWNGDEWVKDRRRRQLWKASQGRHEASTSRV